MKKARIYNTLFPVILLLAAFVPFRQACPAEQDICAADLKNVFSSGKNDNASSPEALPAALQKLKECYYSFGRYGEFVSALKTIAAKKKELAGWTYYYAGTARYDQLAALQADKKWDEYFSSGDTYRREAVEYAQKAVKSAAGRGALPVYSRLLLWQSLREDQDEAAAAALQELLSAVREYALSEGADPGAVKDAADGLAAAGEKMKAGGLYKLYIERKTSGGSGLEEIRALAEQFMKEGNSLSSEPAYDAYSEGLLRSPAYSKEEKIAALLDIAGKFVYKDSGFCDPEYAEKLFAMAESLAGKDGFAEGQLYTRAWNLEKSRSFEAAAERYAGLAEKFPAGKYADEAVFKAGAIRIYALRDTEGGKRYLQKLADSGRQNPYVVSSIYHLALLLQWEGDSSRAAEYYNALIGLAGKHYEEEVDLSRARMAELAGNKPIEYNLRTFLELSFRPENAVYNMSRLELKVSPVRPAPGENISVAASAHTAESGCMPVKLSFLWSGQTGKDSKLSADNAGFSAVYREPGSHIVSAVALHPSGSIDRSFVIIDVR